MPVYSYSCTKCGNISEELRRLADRLIAASCPNCGSVATFSLTAHAQPMTHLYPYQDTNMDHNPVEITSLKQRNQELKKRGLQDCGIQRGGPGRWI